MKTAIVTGASGVIGSAIVKKLVSDGFKVFAHYNNSVKNVETLENELKAVQKVKFNLTDSQDVLNAFNAHFKGQKIDVLINCAGVGLYKLVTQTEVNEWQDLFAINVTGAHQLTSLVLDGMIERKRGKIVNVSSIWGKVGAAMEVAYSASKAAIIGYTKALAKEVGYSGINVNCVCPGVIDTPMNARFSEQEIKELVDNTPIGRIGTGEDVAELVAFLSSESSDFITGQIITVDGGFTL